MPSKRFQRTIEDFTCEHCGKEIKGNGYTDHCSHCLWGKHVDINPGDRADNCKGMMMPVALERASARFRIFYRCERCGHEFRVFAAANDENDALVDLSKKVYNPDMDPEEVKEKLEEAVEQKKVEEGEVPPEVDPFAEDGLGHEPAEEDGKGGI